MSVLGGPGLPGPLFFSWLFLLQLILVVVELSYGDVDGCLLSVQLRGELLDDFDDDNLVHLVPPVYVDF